MTEENPFADFDVPASDQPKAQPEKKRKGRPPKAAAAPESAPAAPSPAKGGRKLRAPSISVPFEMLDWPEQDVKAFRCCVTALSDAAPKARSRIAATLLKIFA